MLPELEILQTFVEVGATFIGFSAIVSVIGASERHSAQLMGVIRTGLVGILVAAVPFILSAWISDTNELLRVCATLGFVFWTPMWVYAAILTRRLLREDPEASHDMFTVFAVFSFNVSGSILSLLVLFFSGSHAVTTLYLGFAFCPLATSALLFANVVQTYLRESKR